MNRDSFLIVTWDGGGNVPPALALASRLTMRGHRVRVIAPPSLAVAVARSGAEAVPYRSAVPLAPNLPHEANWPVLDAILNGPGMVEDLLAEQRREPIGVLVTDSMSGAGLAVGESLGLPTVVLVHTLYQPFTSWGPRFVNIRETRERLGLPAVAPDRFARDVLGRADRVLALVPPGFDYPVESLPPNTTYVGPLLEPATDGATPPTGSDQPTVLISFGSTVQRQRDALSPVLAAIAQMPIRGLLTLGGVLEPSAIVAPPGVKVFGQVPHAELLPLVDAVVCHGGLSTIMAALAAGKPLVVIPQGRDQGDNSARVEAAGCGLSVPLEARPRTIANAIRRVLDDRRFGDAARRLAGEITTLGRGAVATDLVEELLPARRSERADAATMAV